MKLTTMKRVIDYIKNLFGADERLRKWCLERAVDTIGVSDVKAIEKATAFYNYIKGQN